MNTEPESTAPAVSKKQEAVAVPVAPNVPYSPPLVTLKEYCFSKSPALLYGLSALHGDPRFASKPVEEWDRLAAEFWARPATH